MNAAVLVVARTQEQYTLFYVLFKFGMIDLLIDCRPLTFAIHTKDSKQTMV